VVVEPHTTRAGFLFYDVSDLDHPLRGAKLHLRTRLRNADGKELFYFEIPFDKYLKSKSGQMNWQPVAAPLLEVSGRAGVSLPDRAVL
jgi:hypothetical protein